MRKEKSYVGLISHVYNRGTDKRLIFADDPDREHFLACLYLANSATPLPSPSRSEQKDFAGLLSIERGEPLVEIGEFCLMPNHFHLICREVVVGGLSRFMQKAMISYVRYFNTRHGRDGHLFQGPYRAKPVKGQSYLSWLVAYVHANPIDLPEIQGDADENSEKILAALSQYRWSSLGDFQQISASGSSRRLEARILSVKFASELLACGASLPAFLSAKPGLQARLESQALR